MDPVAAIEVIRRGKLSALVRNTMDKNPREPLEAREAYQLRVEELVKQQDEWEEMAETNWPTGYRKMPHPAELKASVLKPGPGDGSVKEVFGRQIADLVNSPDHYTGAGVECIDAIRQALGADGFRAFCQGNVMKYVWRAKFKGNFEQDMAKAGWYARMAAGDDPRSLREKA
jgi:hypothetical protein